MAALLDLMEHQAGNREEGRALGNDAGSRAGCGMPDRGVVVLEQVAEQRRSQGGRGGIVEMRWSRVGIDEWWRNETFWVIGGVSAHLFAVFQGLLKVLTGIYTNFTVASKASDESGESTEFCEDVHIPRIIDSELSNRFSSSTRSQGRFGVEPEYALDNSTTSPSGLLRYC
eukprot:Gb_11862 [translate_table: standard]